MTEGKPSLGAHLFVALQHLLPQHRLSQLMYRLARLEWRPFRRLATGAFIRLTGIRMDEAAEPDPRAYPHLAALFTRALRPGARPLDPDPRAIVSPVDGTLSQIGPIADGRIVQAKGHDYSVRDLLGERGDLHRLFEGGGFATVYLSPKDYHRIHMPVSGDLIETRHLGGRLFSVNAVTAALVPDLFARNERVVTLFGTEAGPMALVLVGAIFVGGIETVWQGEIAPAPSAAACRRWPDQRVRLGRGEEMGRFNLGSTVVLLFPAGTMAWEAGLQPGDQVRMGQRIGTLLGTAG